MIEECLLVCIIFIYMYIYIYDNGNEQKLFIDCPGHKIHVCRRPMHNNLILESYIS